jgi:hypothetical protein
MGDELSKDSPAPVVSLPYYDGQSGPWPAIARFMSWVGIIYAISVIVSQIGLMVMALIEEASFLGAVGVGGNIFQLLGSRLMTFTPILAGSGLLIGSIASLRLRAFGPIVIRWSAVGICLASAAVDIADIRMLALSVAGSSNGKMLVVGQVVSCAVRIPLDDFVPGILWIAFRRREVRDMFERA